MQQPTPEFVLYTRRACHLCDEAKAILARYGIEPREWDVDADSSLAAAHGDWVPVVEVDGQIRFRGRIDEVLLRRLLARR